VKTTPYGLESPTPPTHNISLAEILWHPPVRNNLCYIITEHHTTLIHISTSTTRLQIATSIATKSRLHHAVRRSTTVSIKRTITSRRTITFPHTGPEIRRIYSGFNSQSALKISLHSLFGEVGRPQLEVKIGTMPENGTARDNL
jgi:hypothetical protein